MLWRRMSLAQHSRWREICYGSETRHCVICKRLFIIIIIIERGPGKKPMRKTKPPPAPPPPPPPPLPLPRQGKFLLVQSWDPGYFTRGGWDPRLWNLEYNSRSPEYNQRLESRIQVPLTLESSIWNPKFTAWNPEFPYKHGAKRDL